MTGRRIPAGTLAALARRLEAEDLALAKRMRTAAPGPAYEQMAARRTRVRTDLARVSHCHNVDLLLLDTREPVRADSHELMGADLWGAA